MHLAFGQGAFNFFQMKSSDPPVIIKTSFEATREALWNALTVHSEMVQWFFDNIPDFKPEVGFKTSFPVSSEDRTFTHLWEITEVEPFEKITYNWKYKEYPGDSFAAFELIQGHEDVMLKLTLTILRDFPDNIPEFTWESCKGGWNYFLGERLKSHLETQYP